jgi:hypothetical protein
MQEVSDENYNEFFKQTFGEFLDPLAHVHFNVEVGEVEASLGHCYSFAGVGVQVLPSSKLCYVAMQFH